MRYTLGIDLGSSGLKITFLDELGRSAGPFTAEISTIFPKPGWAEQAPDDWYRTFVELFARSARRAGIAPKDIAAVALDAATHTTVLLDETMRPLRNAIMWNDQRSAAAAKRLEAEHGEMILAKTYHAPSAMWSLCQMLWVKENEPEVWGRVRKLLFAKDYLRLQLGGGYVTDYIDAQGSQLVDMRTLSWDGELCGLLGAAHLELPKIVGPADIAGAVSGTCAEETGIPKGTPIYAGASDTAMELLAAGAVKEGSATMKLASSGRLCVVTDRAYPDRLMVNYSHVVPGLWYPGTGTRSCATSLRWFKDQFCAADAERAESLGQSVYAVLDGCAGTVPVGAEGLFFHPYLLGEFTPYQNPDLRASFVGASMKHTRAHFARAVMEGCVFSLLDCFETLKAVGVSAPKEFRLIGGGASGTVWSQIAADMFQCPLQKPRISDSSYGSAMLAAVAFGFFADFEEAVQLGDNTSVRIDPHKENGARYKDLFGVYKKIQKVLEGIYAEMADKN